MNTNKKKVGILTAVAAIMMAAYLLAGQGILTAASSVGTVAASSGLKVREGAGTSYKEVATIPNGTTVTIEETQGDSTNGWYKISCTVDGVTVTGYVSAAYIVCNASATPTPPASSTPSAQPVTTYRYETTYEKILVPAKIQKSAKVYKSAAGERKVLAKKKVTLPKNKQVKLLSEKTVNNKKWFKIRFKWKGKTRYGYVQNSYVKMTLKKAASGKIMNVKTKVKVRKKKGVSSAYLKSGSSIVKIAKGTTVTLVKDVANGKTSRWYKVSFDYNGKKKTGYVHSKYVKLTKTPVVKKVAVTVMSDAEFEKYMTAQGFPDSYKNSLRILHQSYPYWQYQAYKTGLKWSDAVANEFKPGTGLNLISNSKAAAWKSMEVEDYDAVTNKWKVYDGSTWVAASKEAVAYYMDPRNFLNDRSIFQFELLEYQSQYQTKSGVETILKNTPFSGQSFNYSDLNNGSAKTISYENAFIEAAKYSGVSPYHLASRVKQEVVTGPNSTSIAVTGENKTYPGIFNFYNIGAVSSTNPAENGLKWASTGSTYLRPWKDRYRSILGGAEYIGSKYIRVGQNTGYLQKFNVTASSRYSHQYMTNVEAAYSEAIKTKTAYEDMLNTTPILFSIPIYEDMPEEVCAAPKS